VAGQPFFIAHRGSGDNWTEHTALAYSSAIAAGAHAIEVSVHSTSDGVLVCHHDASTLRLTGRDEPIATQDYADIAALRADARQWLGPSAAPQPIPKLADVLDAHAPDSVIFIEDKQGTNTRALLDLMDRYPSSKDRFVWKQPAASKARIQAQSRGYKTWGYFMDGSGQQFEQHAGNHDFVGLFHAASDEDIRRLVGFGKPVIVWEVHTRWMRDRLQALGVRGLMCSNFPYVTNDLPLAKADAFASGTRAAGDLPWAIDWKLQPRIQPGSSSIRLGGSDFTYSMGSLCPVPAEAHAIDFEVRWAGPVPQSAGQVGVAFGLQDDSPYLPNVPGPPGGYHLLINVAGKVELYRRTAGGTATEVIASADTAAPREGQWLKFSVSVTSEGVSCSRLDNGQQSLAAADTTYRGRYFMLCKSRGGELPVEFRSVSVAP
jgi:glycerophosphoryl diester phosphodiesterase